MPTLVLNEVDFIQRSTLPEAIAGKSLKQIMLAHFAVCCMGLSGTFVEVILQDCKATAVPIMDQSMARES